MEHNLRAQSACEPVSPERTAYLKRIKREHNQVKIFQFSILAIFFALWEVAANLRWVDPFIMSSPSRIFVTIPECSGAGTYSITSA